MNMPTIIFGIAALSALSLNAHCAGFVEGTPTTIMKSDYLSMHLTFIKFSNPISSGNCSSGAGVVLHDSNESSKIGVTLAITALASGKIFQCYVNDNECSTITGAVDTYPVCSYYPSIKN